MQSVYENKELEGFIEGEYVNIRDGESRVLEFIINKKSLRNGSQYPKSIDQAQEKRHNAL